MSHTVETVERGDLIATIEYDPDPMNPREWDNLGTMVCWHRRYQLGDEQPTCDPDVYLHDLLFDVDSGRAADISNRYDEACDAALEEHHITSRAYAQATQAAMREFYDDLWTAVQEHYYLLPLYLYDHSGVTMNTSGFSDPWDSGQVGFIYLSKEDLEKAKAQAAEYGSPNWDPDPYELLRSEVDTYDRYIRGEVYAYTIEDADGNMLDARGGFYDIEDARLEIDHNLDHYAR